MVKSWHWIFRYRTSVCLKVLCMKTSGGVSGGRLVVHVTKYSSLNAEQAAIITVHDEQTTGQHGQRAAAPGAAASVSAASWRMPRTTLLMKTPTKCCKQAPCLGTAALQLVGHCKCSCDSSHKTANQQTRSLCWWKLPRHDPSDPQGGLLHRCDGKMLLLIGKVHKRTICCAKQHYEVTPVHQQPLA